MTKNKTALVTGAAGYLGLRLANSLASKGWKILALDKKFKIDDFDESVRLECDLENMESMNEAIKNIFSEVECLDALINAAAFVGTSDLENWNVDFEKQDPEIIVRAYRVNALAPVYLIQKLVPLLSKTQQAAIVNVSSIYSEFAPKFSMYEGLEIYNPIGYGMSKSALNYSTKYLAKLLGPGIRINTVSPGGIFREQPEEFVRRYSKNTAIGRMASELDIVSVIEFLVSEESKYITGQNIFVDGGWG